MRNSIWPKPFAYFDQVRLFLVALCVTLALVVSGIFIFLYLRTNDLQLARLREQAVAYADLIDHAKEWNQQYGGVYVEKRTGAETNPYLKGLGIDPDIQGAGGRVLTMRNHAIMTAEMSRLSERNGGVRFRMVSRTPLDPGNAPDRFELAALDRFGQGSRELSRLVDEGARPIFRFVKALPVQESCLGCHRQQGFVAGDTLGALSISIPVGTMLAEARTTKIFLITGAILTIGILVTIVYFFTWRMVIKLNDVQSHLKLQASTDELTGLKNRRTIMRRLAEEHERALRLGEPLCIMIADIDHFKRINDSYGHPFGDLVLKGVANCVRENLRRYDTVGRIGGEEFLLISPGVNTAEAIGLAERIRSQVMELSVCDGDLSVAVTISIGVTSLLTGDGVIEALLKRADRALYQAKEQGRNRVVAL